MAEITSENVANPLILVGVEDRREGELLMTLKDGEQRQVPVAALTLLVLDEDKNKFQVDLVIPADAGPELLAALLTEDQWEAVTNV